MQPSTCGASVQISRQHPPHSSPVQQALKPASQRCHWQAWLHCRMRPTCSWPMGSASCPPLCHQLIYRSPCMPPDPTDPGLNRPDTRLLSAGSTLARQQPAARPGPASAAPRHNLEFSNSHERPGARENRDTQDVFKSKPGRLPAGVFQGPQDVEHSIARAGGSSAEQWLPAARLPSRPMNNRRRHGRNLAQPPGCGSPAPRDQEITACGFNRHDRVRIDSFDTCVREAGHVETACALDQIEWTWINKTGSPAIASARVYRHLHRLAAANARSLAVALADPVVQMVRTGRPASCQDEN